MDKKWTVEIPEGETCEVGILLRKQLGLSRHEISRLKFQKGLWSNGKPVKVTDRLEGGQILEVIFHDYQSIADSSLPEVEILYEDTDLVIVNKPSGLAVHPSHGHLTDSLGQRVQAHYARQYHALTLRCIGRLDKEVSGAVLFAKNQPAAARLWRAHESGTLTKKYLAIMSGILSENQDVTVPIDVGRGYRRIVSENGLYACSHFEVLAHGDDYTIAYVTLETGRTHQIRVHAAWINHPLLGDTLYGGPADLLDRVALHCAVIECDSPFTNEHICVRAPLPDDLQKIKEKSKA